MRIIIVVMMACLLSGCGSIISRTIPGQGHGNQYYPGVKWDLRDSAWPKLRPLLQGTTAKPWQKVKKALRN